MNLLLFIIILIVSFVVVRIGAIAFELTGLESSLAKFQALSCFTGTGFTTKEAELITGNPQRRHIASVLIVLGHAGLVTLIATFANSLRTDIIMPWINLAILAIAVYIIYKIFTHTKFAGKLTDALRARIVKQEIIKPVTFEELMVLTGGYGVSSVEIGQNSPILNKTIIETDLRSHDIMILVIERNGETIPNPSADTRILLDDRVICFGRLSNIRKQLCLTPQ
jgi:hypothetical protein